MDAGMMMIDAAKDHLLANDDWSWMKDDGDRLGRPVA